MKLVQPNFATDAMLLQQVEQGSKLAFDTLYEKYWEMSFSNAYKRLKDIDLAKDIVQEIFIHIWLNREALHIDNLPAYLNIAIRNRVIKLVAKQKITHPFFTHLNSMPEKKYLADGELLWKEFLTAYEALVNTLPPKRQLVFRLRFQEDMSTLEIAKELGLSRKTVQNQLTKATDQLRTSLQILFILLMVASI